MNIEDLFKHEERKHPQYKRLYDVKITQNKSGDHRMVVRFGFINQAAKAFSGYDYIEVSNIEKSDDKIYFKLSHEKTGYYSHRLCTNGKSKTICRYTSLTPTAKGEKLYRAKWVNYTFEIKYDDEHDMYYIERTE